jgi:beta-aspartyl-dipeptidase (metallo-type)
MFTLLHGGEVYVPEPTGKTDVLFACGRIAQIGNIDVNALERTGLPVEVCDVHDCYVVPGLIDPHEHLLGGSGEQGYATQTPELALREIVSAGITTVVGCLGTDTTTKTMPGLLAKAKAFNAEGLTAYIYSGGYNVPPVTLTGSVRTDLLYISEVIGAGETAISDARSTEPSAAELARLVRDAYVGGILSGKAGIVHFHVGAGSRRLALLRTLLDDFEIDPGRLYPTHVQRTQELMLEAVELSRRGVSVDVDTVEHDLVKWLKFYFDHDGDPARITASSDAAVNSPRTLLEQIRLCARELPIEKVLPVVTRNTAMALKLPTKGCIRTGFDADLVVLSKDMLEVVHVFANGRCFIRNGAFNVTEQFLKESNREIVIHGDKF